jgi:hypothetical protein
LVLLDRERYVECVRTMVRNTLASAAGPGGQVLRDRYKKGLLSAIKKSIGRLTTLLEGDVWVVSLLQGLTEEPLGW